MFIPFQNIFNSLQTSYGVLGIKCRPDLFNLDFTIILEKKQYYIYLDMLQIITEKKLFMTMKQPLFSFTISLAATQFCGRQL